MIFIPHLILKIFYNFFLHIPSKESIAIITFFLVYVGINTSDHDNLFAQMANYFKEANHHIATLSSTNCPNLKTTIKVMIEHFVGEKGEEEEEIDVSL